MDVKPSMVELGKNLTTQLIPKLLAQPNIGIPEPITSIVLGTLIGVLQQEQQNITNKKLKKLFGSYYQKGERYLRAADNADGEQRRDWINQALDNFMTASSLEEDALLAAKSEFFVGVCFDLLNNSIAAREGYEQAYRAASQLRAQWVYRPRQLAQLHPFMNTLSQVLRAHGSTLIPQERSFEGGIHGVDWAEFSNADWVNQ